MLTFAKKKRQRGAKTKNQHLILYDFEKIKKKKKKKEEEERRIKRLLGGWNRDLTFALL